MSVGPNLRPRILLSDERVIGRHCAVIVQTENLSGQRVKLLGQLSLSRVSRCYIKLAVGPKSQTAPSVKLRRRNIFDNDFAIGKAGGRLAITHYAHELAAGIIGVRKIEQMIR